MGGLVDPTGRVDVRKRAAEVRGRLAPGQALGLLDNGKRNARQLLEALAREMGGVAASDEVVLRTKPSSSLPASEEILEELAARCRVVLAGVGD